MARYGLTIVGIVASARASLLPTSLWINHRQLIGPDAISSPVVDSVPRFSWFVEVKDMQQGTRAVIQSAYQLVVSGPAGETLCDSGKVVSNATHLVSCPTLDATSFQSYSSVNLTWKVRSWCWLSQQGEPCESSDPPGSWSASASFLAALTDVDGPVGINSSAAWDDADWVGSSQPGNSESIMLRAALEPLALPAAEIQSVQIHWIGLGYGRLWVNGCPLRINQAAPAACVVPVSELSHLVQPGDAMLGPWTVWTKRLLYRTTDITPSVRSAVTSGLEIVIGAMLSQGQYAGNWAPSWSPIKGATPPNVLRAVLAYRLSNGTVVYQPIRAADTIAAQSPITKANVYAGESWNLSLAQPGFSTQDFVPPSSQWKQAEPIASEWASVLNRAALRAHTFSAIRVGSQPREPVRQWRSSDRSTTFDFGANYVGTFSVDLPPGVSSVSVSLGEQLRDADGTVCTEQCASGNGTVYYPFGGQIFEMSGGNGNSTSDRFSPGFVYAGFRFATLVGDGVSIRAFVVRSDAQAIGDTGFYAADSSAEQDPLPGYQAAASTVAGVAMDVMPVTVTSPAWFLNSFLQRSLRTLASNTHSIMSDCPTRERVGWTGDAAATMRAAALRLDMASFHSKWAIDMVQSQGYDGSLPSTIPYAKHLPPVDPSWPTAFPRIAELFATIYGDYSTAMDLQEPVAKYVDYLPTVTSCANCKHDGSPLISRGGLPLYNMNGDWMQNRPQWLGARFSGPFFGAANYIHDVRVAASLAGLAGDSATQSRLLNVASNATEVFNSLFVVNATRGHIECDASEEAEKGGRDLWLRCADGGTISNITFVSWGTPSGSCAELDWAVNSTCNSPTARAVIEKLCVGQAACFPETSTEVLGDPCVGTIKSLAIVAECDGYSAPTSVASSHYGGGDGETAMALETGLASANPTPLVGEAEQALLWLVQARGNLVWSGFWGNRYVLSALGNAGMSKLALQVATGSGLPSFGAQALRANLTSLSENWSGSPDATNGNAAPSHNHHAMGGWAHWLITRVAGLDPWGLQYQDLQHKSARAGLATPIRLGPSGAASSAAMAAGGISGAFSWRIGHQGNVSVDWRVSEASQFTLTAIVPAGSTAHIVVPVANAQQVVNESGIQVWPVTSAASAPGVLVAGIQSLDRGHQLALVLEVGSGTYLLSTAAI